MLPVGNFLLTCKSLNSKNVKYPVWKFLLPCMVSSDNQKQIFQFCVQNPLIVLSWLVLLFTNFPCSWIKLTRPVNSLLLYLNPWAAMSLAGMEHHFHVLLGKGGCTAKWGSVTTWGRGLQSWLRWQMKRTVGSQKSFLSPASRVAQSLGSRRFFLFCMGWPKTSVSTEFIQGR